MIARMRSVFGWIRRGFGNVEAIPARARKRPNRVPSIFDTLERREVLSSATFSPFATLPGQVTTAGTPAQVTLHFSAGQITASKAANVLVGFYAEAAPGSTVTPQITEVDGPSGPLSRVYLPKRGGISPSKSLFIGYLDASTTAAQDITVDVSEPGKSTGNFVLKAFLPGDANGDGTVDQTDLTLVQAAYGTGLGQTNNNPAADFNADGHVGCIDLHLTQINQGAHISYGTPTPVAVTSVTPIPIVAPTTTIVTTPVVTTPVVTTPVVTTPVVTTPVVTTPVVTTPVVTTPTSLATTTASATNAAIAIPASPTVPYLAYVYPQANGTAVITPTLTSGTTATSPAYYYGQPVVQAPSYAQTSPASPTYYYGQPVAQVSSSAVSSVPTPVYYMGGQASTQSRST